MRSLYVISCVAFTLLIGSCTKPSAETLIERFQDQKSTFQSIALRLQEQNGHPEQVYADDRNFGDTLGQLGIQGIRWEDKCHIWLYTKANSIVPDRTERGYAVLCEKPKSLVTDLDNHEQRTPYYDVYQPLEGQWYLYAKRTP